MKCYICPRSGISEDRMVIHLVAEHTVTPLAEELHKARRLVSALQNHLGASRNGRHVVCEKIGYPSQDKAGKEIQRAILSGGNHRHEIRAYRCSKCGYWHLTSQANSVEVLNSVNAGVYK